MMHIAVVFIEGKDLPRLWIFSTPERAAQGIEALVDDYARRRIPVDIRSTAVHVDCPHGWCERALDAGTRLRPDLDFAPEAD